MPHVANELVRVVSISVTSLLMGIGIGFLSGMLTIPVLKQYGYGITPRRYSPAFTDTKFWIATSIHLLGSIIVGFLMMLISLLLNLTGTLTGGWSVFSVMPWIISISVTGLAIHSLVLYLITHQINSFTSEISPSDARIGVGTANILYLSIFVLVFASIAFTTGWP